jgi:fatty-acyl-CoA synthase
MERMGFDITHVYGLTETYGPAAVWRSTANGIGSTSARAERNGRQGVRYTVEEGMTVMIRERWRKCRATARRSAEIKRFAATSP